MKQLRAKAFALALGEDHIDAALDEATRLRAVPKDMVILAIIKAMGPALAVAAHRGGEEATDDAGSDGEWVHMSHVGIRAALDRAGIGHMFSAGEASARAAEEAPQARPAGEEAPKPASGAQIDMARFLEAATVEQEERSPKAVCGDRLLRAVDEVAAARGGVT